MSLYLPTQIRSPIGGERVTSRGLKLTNSIRGINLTNSPGKQQLEFSTRTWSGRAPWNRGKFVKQPASSKRFLGSLFYVFEFGGMRKHSMTVSFVLRRPQCSPRRTLSASGKQNSLFPLGSVIKCPFSTSKQYSGIITFYPFMQNVLAPSKTAW